MRINPEFLEADDYVRSNRARVAGALEKDRNGLHHRFDPTLFCSSHKFRRFLDHTGHRGKLFFENTDIPAALYTGDSNF
jgi:hypothetical protein